MKGGIHEASVRRAQVQLNDGWMVKAFGDLFNDHRIVYLGGAPEHSLAARKFGESADTATAQAVLDEEIGFQVDGALQDGMNEGKVHVLRLARSDRLPGTPIEVGPENAMYSQEMRHVLTAGRSLEMAVNLSDFLAMRPDDFKCIVVTNTTHLSGESHDPYIDDRTKPATDDYRLDRIIPGPVITLAPPVPGVADQPHVIRFDFPNRRWTATGL